MDAQQLEQFGLNATQIKGYIALVQHGTLTPPQLAEKIGVTRTNAYEVLSQLIQLGLAHKDERAPKATYRPDHPSVLEKLVQRRKDRVLEQEQRLRQLMPSLMTYFNTYSEQPGVRFYQGEEGVKEVLRDILRTKQPISLVRTTADSRFLTKDYLRSYVKDRAAAGIHVQALTPFYPTITWSKEQDKERLVSRTWIGEKGYTAPVEIDIYGDKVAFISFGEEAMGTIIESPHIAEAMRQLFSLIQVGAKSSYDQDHVPTSE